MSNDSVENISALLARQALDGELALKDGLPSLRRLVNVAQRDTGQSSVCARFLLGLYDGSTYPFDLTELRRLDDALVEDCLRVLRMSSRPTDEIHNLVEHGHEIFDHLRIAWPSNSCAT